MCWPMVVLSIFSGNYFYVNNTSFFHWHLFFYFISNNNCRLLTINIVSFIFFYYRESKPPICILWRCLQGMLIAVGQPAWQAVGKPRTDSVPPTMQSQIPKSRDVTLFFFLDMTLYQQRYPEFQRWFQANDIINTRIHASVTLQFYLKNGFNKNEYFFQFYLWRYSVKFGKNS
jgi:hypothetical protein